MSVHFQYVPIGKVATPIERPESPIAGKVYRQIGVRWWGEGVYEREPIDGADTQYAVMNVLDTNDIVMNKIWARHGSVSVVQPELAGCYCSTEFPIFRPNENELDPRWFYWITKTQWFWNLCDEKSQGTSGKNRIRPDRFLQIEIPLPPLPEQQRIVAKIERLAGKIEEAKMLRSASASSTSSLLRAQLDQLFFRFQDEFGHRNLGSVCISITDGDHITPRFADQGVKFIFVGNVSSGRLHFHGCKYVASDYFSRIQEARRPRRGDILYSAVGATLGIPAVVDTDDEFCFQRHIAILKPNLALIQPRFLWYLLQSKKLYSAAWANATGSAQPTVPLKAIRMLPVVLPPMDRQKQAVTILDNLLAKIDGIRQFQTQTAVELDGLLPSILDRAFSGQL